MTTPLRTLALFQQFCDVNTEHQPIDWLRFATHAATPEGGCWTVKQDTGRIELHVQGHEALLLLWIEGEVPPPMDNIKPQWDTTPMVQRVLGQVEHFPQAVAWTPHLQHGAWSSIWLATQWWPLPGVTDAVDDPQAWMQWWWQSIMEFTSEPPSLYDAPTV